MRDWLNLPRYMRAMNAAIMTGFLIAVATLSHGFLLGVVLVLCVISLLLIIHPEVDQINVNLDNDGRIGLDELNVPTEFVVHVPRKKGWQRVHEDRLFCFPNRMGSMQYPLALNFGGRQVTVVVQRCVHGVSQEDVLDDLWRAKSDATANSGSSLVDTKI